MSPDLATLFPDTAALIEGRLSLDQARARLAVQDFRHEADMVRGLQEAIVRRVPGSGLFKS